MTDRKPWWKRRSAPRLHREFRDLEQVVSRVGRMYTIESSTPHAVQLRHGLVLNGRVPAIPIGKRREQATLRKAWRHRSLGAAGQAVDALTVVERDEGGFYATLLIDGKYAFSHDECDYPIMLGASGKSSATLSVAALERIVDTVAQHRSPDF